MDYPVATLPVFAGRTSGFVCLDWGVWLLIFWPMLAGFLVFYR